MTDTEQQTEQQAKPQTATPRRQLLRLLNEKPSCYWITEIVLNEHFGKKDVTILASAKVPKNETVRKYIADGTYRFLTTRQGLVTAVSIKQKQDKHHAWRAVTNIRHISEYPLLRV